MDLLSMDGYKQIVNKPGRKRESGSQERFFPFFPEPAALFPDGPSRL
jgi:hypothetical protein